METLPNIKAELKQEYETTKKFFDAYPEGKNDYAPHEKSMKMMPLATHIAEIFGWPAFMLNTEKLDFNAGDYKPTVINTKAELIKKLDDDYNDSIKRLEEASENELNGRWKMTMGDHVIADYNKYEAIRHALSQATHHRAQLGVYYRLNDIPLPGSYGPSADNENF